MYALDKTRHLAIVYDVMRLSYKLLIKSNSNDLLEQNLKKKSNLITTPY